MCVCNNNQSVVAAVSTPGNPGWLPSRMSRRRRVRGIRNDASVVVTGQPLLWAGRCEWEQATTNGGQAGEVRELLHHGAGNQVLGAIASEVNLWVKDPSSGRGKKSAHSNALLYVCDKVLFAAHLICAAARTWERKRERKERRHGLREEGKKGFEIFDDTQRFGEKSSFQI